MNHLRLLKKFCSLPTAPFAESRVRRFIEAFVARNPKLSLRADKYGNLLVSLKSSSKAPRWVFTAHMDHPGFIARKMIDAKTLEADFRGWVRASFIENAKVRFFDSEREIPGKVISTTITEYDRLDVPSRVKIRVNSPVKLGSPGMFDQGEGRIVKGKFLCRACDDLAGGAACLAMLEELSRKSPRSPVSVLFTRAEEEAFIGCVAACEDGSLLRKSDRVIAIECSAVQPHAPQGNGVIIRVGDKASIFNSALTYFLSQQAEQLQKTDKKFNSQRALMPGGTCEATVYDIWGFTAASLCVPMANYHNMDTKRNRIAPEFVDVADWQNMVKLFVRLAQEGHHFAPGHGDLKKRILKRYNRLKKFLK